MVAQAFGDAHTRQKLETVQKYLRSYVTALKFQDFELLYIDACAGSGSSVPKSALSEPEEEYQVRIKGFDPPIADTDEIIVGSAIRALGVSPPFSKYLLNDVSAKNVAALQSAVQSTFPHLSERVQLSREDANSWLLDICRSYDWKRTRAVVFIDPFGLQIDYSTLVELGKTGAIDLWYLVPVFAMFRQVSRSGEVHADGGRRVDSALGTAAWREVVATLDDEATDLFGTVRRTSKRAVDVRWFERVAKDQLRIAFDGRVLDETLPLGRSGTQEFSLMFAWANPGQKAAELAQRLARAVLR